MSSDSISLKPRLPKWKTDIDRKLYRRGPFKLKLGSKTFRFRYAADFSAARAALSTGRFKGVGEMIDAIKVIPNGY